MEMENVSASLSGSEAPGVNEYVAPAFTLLGGVPEIRGGEFAAAALTVIENAARLAEDKPSETLITMFPSVPASPIVGMPDSLPVDESKLAQGGCFEIENVSVSPSSSDADGVNEYISPAFTLPGGVPEIRGAVLAGAAGSPAPLKEVVESSSDRQPARIAAETMAVVAFRIHVERTQLFMV